MASVKGGSGKTVLAATFGTILSGLGKRVLLVDTDAATNGMTLLYMNEVVEFREAVEGHELPVGTYELEAEGEVTPQPVPLGGGLEFLPAMYSFFDSETRSVDAYTNALTDAVEKWRGEFDFVFLDAQAGSDGFAHGAMRREVSDQVILVSEYDPLSAAGVERLKALFPEDLSYERIWILLNKMLPDIATKYGEFFEVARYLPPITWNADVVRAYARRSLALDLDYGNDYTVAACRCLASMVDAETQGDLEAWLAGKANELRVPLTVQIDDLRAELAANELRIEAQMSRKATLNLAMTTAVAVTLVAGLLVAALSNGGHPATVASAIVLSFAVAALWVTVRTREEGEPDERLGDLRARLATLERLSDLSDRELVGRGKAVASGERKQQ